MMGRCEVTIGGAEGKGSGGERGEEGEREGRWVGGERGVGIARGG